MRSLHEPVRDALLVSVVIPAFNAEDTIARAIESVSAAFDAAGIADRSEIVVIDDGSRDQTAQRVRESAGTAPLRLLQHPNNENRGVSASRNLGIQSSGSRYVSFLDGDDTFCCNRFECVDRILEADSAVDAVYGDTTVVVEDVSQETSWEDGQYFGVGDPCTGSTLLSRLIQSHPWATSAITARRCLLEKTGLFSDKLSVAEDCHLWMRMASIGNIVHTGLSEPISVYHRQADSLYRAGVENKSHYSKALQLFYRWLKRQTVRQEVLTTAKQEISAWIDNSLIQLRSEKRLGMLVRLLAGWIAVAPELTLHRRNASHTFRALVGQ